MIEKNAAIFGLTKFSSVPSIGSPKKRGSEHQKINFLPKKLYFERPASQQRPPPQTKKTKPQRIQSAMPDFHIRNIDPLDGPYITQTV
jgi:hypothetical protein